MQVICSQDYQRAMQEDVLPYLRERVQVGFSEGIYHELYPQPQGGRGTVVISHGFTENCAKFAEVIYYLHRSGYQVAALDHRGHGRSQREEGIGRLVHIDRFDAYVDDLDRLMEQVFRPFAAGGELFLLGHSMGGAVALVYLQRHPQVFSRAVLNAPMVQFCSAPISFGLTKVIANTACALGMSRKRVFVTHDYQPDTRLEDSACSGQARFDWYERLCSQEERFCQAAATYGWVRAATTVTESILSPQAVQKLNMPILMLSAGQDTYVRQDAIDRLCAGLERVKRVHFPESRHEIYRGEDQTVQRWLDEVLAFLQT